MDAPIDLNARTRRNRIIAITILTLTIGWLYVAETSKFHNLTEELSITEARTTVTMNLAFRHWITSYEEVYVPENKAEGYKPPEFIRVSEIYRESGNLTQISPEYALRSFNEMYSSMGGVISHLTSLKPLRIDNKADEWEESALRRLEDGELEVVGKSLIDGESYLRLMVPLVVEESCLRCHGQQGYIVGDIRGGISTSVPLRDYAAYESDVTFVHGRNYGLIWLVGFVGIIYGSKRLRMQMEEQMESSRLREHNSQLERMDALKSQFISTATHDLRTPLTSIMGYIEILREKDLSLDSGEFWKIIDIIERNADRASHLTSDLLDIERMESGKLHLDLSKVSVDGLLGNIREEITPVIIGRKQSLVYESGAAGLEMVADERRLSQVFINLLSNASKFSPEGSEISLRVEESGDFIGFCVTDQGIGVSEEDLGKLFKPFPDIRVTGNVQRIGLGLSICKEIVELHGGEIWAESGGVAAGSKFCFILPVRGPDLSIY